MDSQGTIDYDVRMDDVFKELFDYDPEVDFPDEKTQQEMSTIQEAYKIAIDQSEELSNGDKVVFTVSVNEEATKKIKGGKKEFTVEGLEVPEQLTSAEVEDHLVIDFLGVSGRGYARIDNKLDGDLQTIRFEVEDDGVLKNGEQATIVLGEDQEDRLFNYGYILAADFNPTVEVKGLDEIAEKAEDIQNYEDLKRMIREEVQRTHQDFLPTARTGRVYEIIEEEFMYRQFNDHDLNQPGSSIANVRHGDLIAVFTIKQYQGGDDGKLQLEFIAMEGYTELKLDEDNKVDISEIRNINKKFDKTYSLETVIQTYESEGYSIVKD